MITKKRKNLLFISLIFLWVIVVLKYAAKDNFDFTFLFSWIAKGLGYAFFSAIAGIIVGGFVLFNIVLFFCNLLKPSNKLSFDHVDRTIAGLWIVIIFSLFSWFNNVIMSSTNIKNDE